VERETTQRLIKARKLSLVVDLDQTIIHATVNQAVQEWLDQIRRDGNPLAKVLAYLLYKELWWIVVFS